MVTIKNLKITNAGEGVRKGNPPTLLGAMYIGIATMESHTEVAKKTKNRATI